MHNYAPSLRAHVLSEGRTSSSSSSSALSPQQQGNFWSSDAVAEGICFTSISFEMNLKASVSRPHLLRWAWRHSFHFHIIWHIFWDEHEDILRWTWRHPCISRYLLKWTWRHSFHFHICWDEQEGICFTSIPIDMNVKSFVSLPYLLRCTRRHSFHSHIFWREHIFPILLNTCAFICDWVIRIYFLPFP